jgi:tyrosyl-tRNA synthetase
VKPIETFAQRGLLHQTTDPALDDVLAAEPRTVYCGFDPSAPGLHVGNLVPIMALMRLQRAGHRPIGLVGGGTGLIGDPSGKTVERQLLGEAQIEENCRHIHALLAHFLDVDDPRTGARLLDNADWIRELNYTEFLRDIGKHFSVNVMLTKESVRSRIEDREHGLSYTEFSYMLLQAYDFLHLYDHEGCVMQLGASDQWGNIVAGIDLVRRMRGVEAYGFTLPLVTRSDGTKFGKSESGAVWLNTECTSHYDFYQFWIRTDDRDVAHYLRTFTFLDDERIGELERELESAPEQRGAHRVLAEEVTRLVRGEDGLRVALKATEVFYGGDIKDLSDDEIGSIFQDVASTQLARGALAGDGVPLLEALVQVGVATSNGAARRLVQGGGIYVNNQRVSDPALRLTAADLASTSFIVLRKGKRDYFLLRFE